MSSLSTTKKFSHKAKDYSCFYNENGEPRMNIEGIVEIAGVSDIDVLAMFADSSCYIGKSSGTNGGDFLITYTSPTTLTLSGFPGSLTAIYAADIEYVRQINVAGTVTGSYHRDDTTMLMTGAVLTVTGATFLNTDKFLIFTNIPRSASSGSGGAGGGSIVYTNMSGDFTATPTNGAATITITGLPFTLEAKHVAAGSITKIAVTTGVKTLLNPSSISVSGGVITLGGITNFATGDELAVTLIGPDKAYDTALDNQLVNVQNPSYAHTTAVEQLVYEDDFTGTNNTADAGGDATHFHDTTPGGFANSNVAVGYKAYNITEGGAAFYGTVSTVAATQIDFTGSTVADWSSDEYYLPGVKRYEINMDTYNFLTIQYILTTVANVTCYLKMWGTLDATATVDDDTNWDDVSSVLLYGMPGYSATYNAIVGTGAATIRGLRSFDQPTPMLKYMIKLVVEKTTTGVSTGCLYTVNIKKSS